MKRPWRMEEWHNRTALNDSTPLDAYRVLDGDGGEVLNVSVTDEARDIRRALTLIVWLVNRTS